MEQSHSQEVSQGERFKFGDNWQRFLTTLNDTRIAEAEKALKDLLEVDNLNGKTFLDVGSGSGLMSLVARRLGANVYSFDYDPQSVACTRELKKRYFANDENWHIEAGSVLDAEYMQSLGKFDVVYSWGVLHHTGQMWKAIDNAQQRTKLNGNCAIAIYNSQGAVSGIWWHIKSIYNKIPNPLQTLYVFIIMLPYELRGFLISLFRFRLDRYFKRWRQIEGRRGMSIWHDWVDWVGGFPFEVAKPEEIHAFFRSRGFVLDNLITVGGGWGNNEFVFHKVHEKHAQ